MTEKEKMLNGLPYDPYDPELTAGRMKARHLLRELAVIPEDKERQRKHIFRQLLGTVGQRFLIENAFRCDYGYNIHWGENAYANFDCIILDAAQVHIGENVMLGPGVRIFTSTHPIDAATRNLGPESAFPVHIGDSVWVGGGAIVNPGVTIGRNSVIGSGSVVTQDIPENVVAVGNPCRVLRTI